MLSSRPDAPDLTAADVREAQRALRTLFRLCGLTADQAPPTPRDLGVHDWTANPACPRRARKAVAHADKPHVGVVLVRGRDPGQVLAVRRSGDVRFDFSRLAGRAGVVRLAPDHRAALFADAATARRLVVEAYRGRAAVGGGV